MLCRTSELQVFAAVIDRITYPNGKIYVGQDRRNSISYFGSASSALIAVDFSQDQLKSFTITSDVFWEIEGCAVGLCIGSQIADLNQPSSA